jgi:hypothetical protein
MIMMMTMKAERGVLRVYADGAAATTFHHKLGTSTFLLVVHTVMQ